MRRILLKNNPLVRAAMLLLAVLSSVGAWAKSDVVTIGEPKNDYGHMLPIGALNKYALTQQVYTAKEINHASGKVWSLGFNTVKGNMSRHLSIYVTHTSESGVWSYTPPTANDLYFSGDMYFKAGQWNTIEFDKPFVYNGSSNILITICDDTGTSGDYTSLTNRFYNPGSTHLIYATDDSEAFNPTAANEESDFTSISSWKAQIQLTFGEYPTPSGFAVTDISNVTAQVQCSLRGEATSWNLRYRKVGTEEWTTLSNLTTRSNTLESLTPATDYEAQVQAVFAGNNTSDWTASVTFTTTCCPIDLQANLMYSLYSAAGWNDLAVQIVDQLTGVEVAYLHSPSSGTMNGTIPLCPDRFYDVNWVYNESSSWERSNVSFSLAFEPGDVFFSVGYGQVPAESKNLTTFVMEGGKAYSTKRPTGLTVSDVTCSSFTLCYSTATLKEEIQVSTDSEFPEDKTQSIYATRTEKESESSWSITSLDPNTLYYARVRSLTPATESEGEEGVSRWTEFQMAVTDPEYTPGGTVTATPKNSKTEDLSWKRFGKETKNNVNYRVQGASSPAGGDAAPIMALDLDGDGNTFSGGGGTYYSMKYSAEGNNNNALVFYNLPKGASVSLKAKNAKSGDKKIVTYETGSIKQSKKFTTEDEAKTEITDMLTAKQEEEAGEKIDINTLRGKKLMLQRLKQRQGKLYDFAEGLNPNLWSTDSQRGEARGQISVLQDEINQLEKEIAAQEKIIADKQEKIKELEKRVTELAKAIYPETDGQWVPRDLTEEQRTARFEQIDVEEQILKLRVEICETKGTWDAFGTKTSIQAGEQDGSNSANIRGMRRVSANNEEYYAVYILHTTDDMLEVSDITVTLSENNGEWTRIPNVSGTEYALGNLTPGTTYEVMVEPVYENGGIGLAGPITVFTTIGEETDPILADFSVSEEKKVNFAQGNLRYNGDGYEGTWSIAPQQYEVLGQDNINAYSSGSSYPADFKDLFCWSTAKNNYGISNYYYDDDEEAARYFKGDFADWGENPALIADLGEGWSTLSKEEWTYLLNKRTNAVNLKAFATVAGVKGLILLPDDWTEDTPAGTFTAEEWAVLEKDGAVFLPSAGQLTTAYENKTITTLTEAGTYWTSTPSNDEAGWKAFALNFDDSKAGVDAELNRRVATAVRLVKRVKAEPTIDMSNVFAKESKGKWATYIATSDLATPEGLQAYVVSDETETAVIATPVGFIPANVPVLLYRADVTATDFEANPYHGSEEIPSSLLKGSATAASDITPYEDYVLYNDEFVLSSVSVVAIGHAYLPAPNKSVAAARRIVIASEDDITGIKNVNSSTATDAWYTIDGRRLNGKPVTKGIYIHQGIKRAIR